MPDHILISRLGFALTASYHIIFPCLLIGLAYYLAAMELLWTRTGRAIYRQQYEFWLKPFVAAFVVAVITGVGLSYQLDVHFGGFYRTTVDVLVPIRKVELINTIVLEAGTLGIMLCGWRRVGNRLHLAATLLMAVGVTIASVCIIARNSWMQTPDGFEWSGQTMMLTSWLDAVISPSFPYRFAHMLTAALISTACFVLGTSAYLLIRKRHREIATFSLRAAVVTIVVLGPLQALIGHMHGINTKEHQPAKIAAMEALWETTERAPAVLFALPDSGAETNRYSLEIPVLGSLILTHDPDGKVEGLDATPPDQRPNVPLVFFSFRAMVGLWALLMAVGVTGAYLLLRGRLYRSPRFLRACCWMTPVGFLATISGWFVSEVGRQPWVVYGLVRTADVVMPISKAQAIHSLTLMGMVYATTAVGFAVVLWRLLRGGPTHRANVTVHLWPGHGRRGAVGSGR